jgi:hypothetical protein
LRWVFQIMGGIGLVHFYNKSLSQIVREVITKLGSRVLPTHQELIQEAAVI